MCVRNVGIGLGEVIKNIEVWFSAICLRNRDIFGAVFLFILDIAECSLSLDAGNTTHLLVNLGSSLPVFPTKVPTFQFYYVDS